MAFTTQMGWLLLIVFVMMALLATQLLSIEVTVLLLLPVLVLTGFLDLPAVFGEFAKFAII